jgi:hypothetical protein
MDLSLNTKLYYFSPFNIANSFAVCVSSCPNSTELATPETAICDYGIVPTDDADLAQLISQDKCVSLLVNSVDILDRCIPVDPVPLSMLDSLTTMNYTINGYSTNLASLMSKAQNIALKFAKDVTKTWPYIIGALGACMIICFVWIFLLRWITGLLVWMSIIAVNIAMLALSIWLFFVWRDKKDWYDAIPVIYRTTSDKNTYNGYVTAFIVAAVLTGLLILISIGIRKKVAMAIEIIKIASKSITAMPFILLLPFFKWAIWVALVAYYIYILLCLLTTNGQVPLFSEFKKGFSLSDSHMNSWLILFHTFGFLWGWSFIFGVGAVTIAGSAATYYFTFDKKHLPVFPVLRSFYRVFRYNLGSVALGSLLVAIVQTIRLVFWYVRRKALGTSRRVPFVNFILACIGYCLACIEKILKFINKNAYIHISIYGTSFCQSARSALSLIIRNALRTLALDFVAEFVLFLGKIASGVSLFFIAWAVFNWKQSQLELNYTYGPAIVIGVEALIIAYIFFGVYHMTIDTIFLCFLEDCERNDGSAERPYYMPEGLIGLANKKKIIPEQEQETRPKKSSSKVIKSRIYSD